MEKSKGKKVKPVVDGLKLTEMSKPQILGHIKRLLDELDKEKAERNFFMLDREKLYAFWNTLMEQIALEKEKMDLLDTHVQDSLKDNEAEQSLYKQKLRYLKSEQSKKLGEVRLHHLESMKLVQDSAWAIQNVMRDTLLTTKKSVRKAQMAYFEIIRGLHMKHGKELSSLRKDFSHEIRVLETSFDRQLFDINENEDDGQVKELKLLTIRKEEQVRHLVQAHEKQMLDMKTFFNDLTVNNLAVVASLELDLKNAKAEDVRLVRHFESLQKNLDDLKTPMSEWKREIQGWTDEDQGFIQEDLKNDIKRNEKQLQKSRRYERMMECANEALTQRIIIVEQERNDLRKSFSRAVVEMQRKASMKRLVLGLKWKAAAREKDTFNAVANNLDNRSGSVDYFKRLLTARDRKLNFIKEDITELATDLMNTQSIFMDALAKNSIHPAEIGFSLRASGAKPRSQEDNPIVLFHGGGRPSPSSLRSHGHHSHDHNSMSLDSHANLQVIAHKGSTQSADTSVSKSSKGGSQGSVPVNHHNRQPKPSGANRKNNGDNPLHSINRSSSIPSSKDHPLHNTDMRTGHHLTSVSNQGDNSHKKRQLAFPTDLADPEGADVTMRETYRRRDSENPRASILSNVPPRSKSMSIKIVHAPADHPSEDV